MSKSELVQQFNNELIKKLRSTIAETFASRKWDKLHNTIHSIALDTFRRKTSNTCGWFDSKTIQMMPVIEDAHI